MYSAEQRKKAIETFARFGCSAAEVAGRYGVSRAVPYVWRREILGHNGGAPEEKGAPVSKRYDELPDGVEELEKMQSDLKAQVRKLQLEIDVRHATLEILKKDPGTDPTRLTNAEKAAANSSLLGACSQLKAGEHPKEHSDRGCHYRWPGWIKICDDHGIVRSMSRKGCSPDNARRRLLRKAEDRVLLRQGLERGRA